AGTHADGQRDPALHVGVLGERAVIAITESGAHTGHHPGRIAHLATANVRGAGGGVALGPLHFLDRAGALPAAGPRRADGAETTTGGPGTDCPTTAAEAQATDADAGAARGSLVERPGGNLARLEHALRRRTRTGESAESR